MQNLIMPMAGKSSRFNTSRPKWMLTHPHSGNYMALASISKLNLSIFDNLYFVFLQKHQDEFGFRTGFENQLAQLGVLSKSKLIFLPQETESPAQTINEAIKIADIRGKIYVKDSDSYFELELVDLEQCVTYCTLQQVELIDAKSKSYIQMDKFSTITNIVEKQVISSSFSVGGYGFSSATEFSAAYEKIRKSDSEIYISDIIFQMMLSGAQFKGVQASGYEDWGTLESWERYCKQFNTLFVDIDGTLIENTSSLFEPYLGSGKPIYENIEVINKFYDSNKSFIILVTSRPESFRDETISELSKHDIRYHKLIMGLPHAKRFLINDFSTSNPFPSSISINLPRNSDNLGEYLNNL